MDSMHDSTPQPQYLKLEDLQSADSPASSSFDSSTAASLIIHSRPAKKRKSWGQELPEPKTSLPPRKRAKTDDEKEQRRIERIKRNRAAAHNSRERKRQETENLAVLLARARAELDAYKRIHGPLPADVVLPEVTLNKDPESPRQDGLPSPATSLIDSMPSVKAEPTDTIMPLSLFEEAASSPIAIPSLDTTQHSAAMLCDLPCLSSRRRTRSSRTHASSKSSSNCQYSQAMATLFLYHIHLQVQTVYRLTLLTMWTLSPMRMQTLINRLPSTTRSATMHSSSTTSSTLTPLRLSQSTQLLAQPRAATSRALRKGALVALARRRVPRPLIDNVPANDRVKANDKSESGPDDNTMEFGS